MKPSIAAYSYEALAIFRLYGYRNNNYSDLKVNILYGMNKPGNKTISPELVKKDGFDYIQVISKMSTRIERLEALLEDFGNTSGNGIDGKAAAKFLGVSKRTVDDLAGKNKIDSYHIGTRRLYRQSDLAKYRQSLIENNRQQI
jgi:excisionase family DNA binding protein